VNARALAAVALAVAILGCQRAPSPPPPPAGQTETDVVARARQAVARSDWSAAAPLLREALVAWPGDLGLHYGLAVAASYLDLRDEATREFQWVLTHAHPDSQEYKVAKNWLGDDSGAVAASQAPPARSADKPNVLHVERVGDAGLYGRVTWSSEPNGPYSTKRMQVHLTGVAGTPTKEQRYTARTDDDGRYEFKRIVAGPYKVSDRVAGRPVWRLKVEVEPGRDTVLDLNPGNSVSVRDDFTNEPK
jgi:hypothetical protein